ncbi:hypothetical protein ACOSQ3_004349 [Xanthoceras sorbifolium]
MIWLRNLLSELHIVQTRTPIIWCDNLSAVYLSANPVLHSKAKHIELDLYFVREKVAAKQISVQHVPALDKIADVLTKAISSSHFERLKNKLKVAPIATFSLRGDNEVNRSNNI